MHTSLEPPWHLDGSGFSKFIAKNWVFGRNYIEAWPQWEGPSYKIHPWSFDKDPEDDGFQKESRFPGENDFRFHVKLEGHITASCFFWGFWVWSLSQNLQLRCTIWKMCDSPHEWTPLAAGRGQHLRLKKVVIPWVVATQTQDPAWHEIRKLDKNGTRDPHGS